MNERVSEDNEQRERELITGLIHLYSRIHNGDIFVLSPASEQIINEMLLNNPEHPVIPQLHKAGLLGQSIRLLRSETPRLDNFPTLFLDYILKATPEEPLKVPAPSPSTEPLSVTPAGISHKLSCCSGIFSSETRKNLKTAATIARLSIGPTVFLGTGIAGFVISAKAAAAITAVATFAATAGVGFPPLGIALLAAAGATLIAGAIVLTACALSAKNSHIINTAFASSARNVW